MSSDDTLLVVDGATLKFKTSTPPVTGTITVLPASIKSLKVSCNGHDVYTTIAFSITGATNGTVTAGTGAGVITGTSSKVLMNSLSPVRKADEVTVVVTGVIGSSSGTFNATVTVDNAGQSKAWGE
jgi:hypothetical protein